jgi:hypothetical protein
MSSWRGAQLIKHRDNFTFALQLGKLGERENSNGNNSGHNANWAATHQLIHANFL